MGGYFAFEVTQGYAVAAESGHSVGTRLPYCAHKLQILAMRSFKDRPPIERSGLARCTARARNQPNAPSLLSCSSAESTGGRPVIAPTAERVRLADMLNALRADYERKGNRRFA